MPPRFLQCQTVVEAFFSFLATIHNFRCTVKPVFNTTSEIGTTWELRTATSVHRPIQYIEMDLRNKATSEFRGQFFTVPWVSLIPRLHCILSKILGLNISIFPPRFPALHTVTRYIVHASVQAGLKHEESHL